MEIKRCARCGSFFTSDNDVCKICNKKDLADVNKLKNFLSESSLELEDKDQLAMYTGISLKNINRYLNMEEFKYLGFDKAQIKESDELIQNI